MHKNRKRPLLGKVKVLLATRALPTKPGQKARNDDFVVQLLPFNLRYPYTILTSL
jgi:hypothetical protein